MSMAQQTLHIAGMHCASCVDRVERALRAVPGVHEVAVNLAMGQARVVSEDGSPTTPAALRQAVEAAGYTLTEQPGEVGTAPRADTARLIVALVLSIPVLVLSM